MLRNIDRSAGDRHVERRNAFERLLFVGQPANR